MVCGYKKKLNAKLFLIILATSPETVAEKNEYRIFQNLLLTGKLVNTEKRDPKRRFRLHLFTRPEDVTIFSLSFQKPISSRYIHLYILKYNSRHLFEAVKQVFEGKSGST